ncbi:hypothetical protein NLG97_g9914 [Lecanicillium saksenae]|uniref:Uncharacterized protein n=1 Tax=Lecanicillium saksenae TaxID=468837 RepID=A0ACC1QF64_9HYPO|nr:hypothetical protein NLG97_g9914 [Lecanicillium saksenae]
MLSKQSLAGASLALSQLFSITLAQGPYDPGLPIPRISDNSLASPEVADFFFGFYTAKSEHNISRFMTFFDPVTASYADVSLGAQFRNVSALRDGFTGVFADMQPGSIAYPLQVVGDMDSAIVASVDTPGMYGTEVRLLSVFDFKDGKITRALDLWDGRKSPIIEGRGQDEYFDNLGLDNVHTSPDPSMQALVSKLNSFLSKGDAAGAQSLFSYNAELVDSTLRTRLVGQLAIGRYLQRAVSLLPYGEGATLRHVVGKGKGGGYEWKSVQGRGIYGLSLIELDEKGLIKRYVTLWDGSRVRDRQLKSLNALSLE